VDIHAQEFERRIFFGGFANESYEVLYSGPPQGRFAVLPLGVDPIKRKGHFGMVDLEAETRFTTYRSKP
jgi:hypothetical protein